MWGEHNPQAEVPKAFLPFQGCYWMNQNHFVWEWTTVFGGLNLLCAHGILPFCWFRSVTDSFKYLWNKFQLKVMDDDYFICCFCRPVDLPTEVQAQRRENLDLIPHSLKTYFIIDHKAWRKASISHKTILMDTFFGIICYKRKKWKWEKTQFSKYRKRMRQGKLSLFRKARPFFWVFEHYIHKGMWAQRGKKLSRNEK